MVREMNLLQDTRETQILDAAEIVLERFGARRMTMEDVAEVVGLSRPAVYQYFPSKSALVVAALHRFHTRILDRVRTVIASGPDIQSRIKRAIREHDGVLFDHVSGKAQDPWFLSPSDAETTTILNDTAAEFRNIIRNELLKSVHAEAQARFLADLLVAFSDGVRRNAQDRTEFDRQINVGVNRLLPQSLRPSTHPEPHET